MCVTLLQCFVSVLIIAKVVLKKVLQIHPNKCNVYEEQFHHHVNFEGHNGMEEWKISIIERTENVLKPRQRDSYWQHRFDTFISNGLNERLADISML